MDRIERPGTYALAAVLLVGALWWAFVNATRVPLLGMVDLAGGAAALGWAATSLQDAAVYIADAPHRRLPLLGPEAGVDHWCGDARGRPAPRPRLAGRGRRHALLPVTA